MFLREQVLNSYLKQAGGGQACRRFAIVSTYVHLCYLFLDRRSSDSTLGSVWKQRYLHRHWSLTS